MAPEKAKGPQAKKLFLGSLQGKQVERSKIRNGDHRKLEKQDKK